MHKLTDINFSVIGNPSKDLLSFPARLDYFMRLLFPDLTKKKFALICKNRNILLNGRLAKPGDLIHGKEEISFSYSFEKLVPSLSRIIEINKPNIPKLNIIYEDEFILCIDKPRGMHSVLQKASDPVTLADLIADYCPDLINVGRDEKEAGLVQRLDFWTSGLIIAAKTKECWEYLHNEFKEKNVEKTYIAEIEKNYLNLPMFYNDAKLELFKELPDSMLIRITLRHGERHIVRKIFSSLNCPLIGDKEYGSKVEKDGFFLHAESIKLMLQDKKEINLILKTP
jgi:23S rRNA-/tRNA-specific pseudouridylate synthase